MLRSVRLAALAAALLIAPVVLANAQLATSLSVAAGASLPIGSFGDAHDVGYHALVGVGLQAPLTPLGFRFEGVFNEFERTSSNANATRVYGGIANGLVYLEGGHTGFYVIGGVGAYRVERPSVIDGNLNELGVNIGGGYRFALTGFSAYVESRYHHIVNANVNFIPITFGVTF
jgi:hypothetical protein